MLANGDKVLFESEIYTIYYIYDSGYCEISNHRTVRLVELTELFPLVQTHLSKTS